MTNINMSSILAKAQKVMNEPKMQRKVKDATDQAIRGALSGGSGGFGGSITISGMREAADKFIEVLQREIQSHAANGNFAAGGLGPTAVDALIKLDHGEPVKVGDNRYQIGIWFTDDLHRDSLYPAKYSGVDNIAALLNKGYSAKQSVYGVWNGHGDDRIQSLAERAGTHFIENAIREYKANYADNYGVIDVDCDDVYK